MLKRGRAPPPLSPDIIDQALSGAFYILSAHYCVVGMGDESVLGSPINENSSGLIFAASFL